MREIKVRAKRRHWKEHEGWDNWVYSNGYYYDKTNYWFLLPKEYSALAYAEHIIIDIETLGEFTGCKDMNKVEIYESDILKATSSFVRLETGESTGRICTEIYKVIYIEERACFTTQSIKSQYPNGHINKLGISQEQMTKYYEVIGNIFENPELWEKE